MGVSLNWVSGFNWALGAFLSAIAGVLVAPLLLLSTTSFPLLLVKALTASLFGGLASLPLTFAGGLLIGAIESVTSLVFTTPGARDLAVLAFIMAVLAVRRQWSALLGSVTAGAWVRTRSVVLPAGVARAVRPLRPLVPFAIVALALAALVVPFQSEYWGFVGSRALFYVIEALSLVVLAGWGGQISLMNGAYVGIGAFSTAYLVHRGLPLEVSLILAGVAGMVLGLVAVLPALRLSGAQFAIASIAFATMASQWLFLHEPFSAPTSAQLPRERLLGISITESEHLYGVMLVLTAVLYVVVWNLRRGTFGARRCSRPATTPTW